MTNFRLPNFLNDPIFNGLLVEMGAKLIGPLREREPYTYLTPSDLEALAGVGLDVDADQVTEQPDGTLSYKNKRVILYIRDITIMGGRGSLPKYHIAYCRTLETMQRNNRFKRYVVATRDDGVFSLNVDRRPTQNNLDVCQTCLQRLSWEKFSSDWLKTRRLAMVAAFKLTAFFLAYPKDIISVRPDHNSDTAPLNDYPKNWAEISERLKKLRGWCCERCHRDMTGNKQNFHAHHISGQKNDCSDGNITLLCLCCHADEPMHSHMRTLPSFRSFCLAPMGSQSSFSV